MGLSEWFTWSTSGSGGGNEELPDIFPIAITQKDFVSIATESIYAKILTDVVERTQGLTEDHQALLSDNCLASESSSGLITLLANSMSEKRDLFLVYDRSVKVIRKADQTEENQIREDYKKQAKSSVGIYVTFKKYYRTDMVRVWSSLEFFSVSSLHKSMNLAKAIQLKFKNLRGSVALDDSSVSGAQAAALAKALKEGRDVYLDAEDSIETASPDLTATEKAEEFINQKLSRYLGLPAAYITGEQTGGLGTTGENDTKAIERGLKSYYQSIMSPVLNALFGVKTTYKSQDFRQVGVGLEALKTFSLVGEEHLTLENQKKVVEGLFDVDADSNKNTKAPVEPEPIAPPAPAPGVKPKEPPR